MPITIFLSNVLNTYRLHISQLHCIGAAKISNVEVNCHLLAIEPTVDLFCAFYHTTWSHGWVSFAKRPGSLQCYTEKVDSLRNWRAYFFWVDDVVFPSPFEFYTQETLPRMGAPHPVHTAWQMRRLLMPTASPLTLILRSFWYTWG